MYVLTKVVDPDRSKKKKKIMKEIFLLNLKQKKILLHHRSVPGTGTVGTKCICYVLNFKTIFVLHPDTNQAKMLDLDPDKSQSGSTILVLTLNSTFQLASMYTSLYIEALCSLT
jgi:hypothetical protein